MIAAKTARMISASAKLNVSAIAIMVLPNKVLRYGLTARYAASCQSPAPRTVQTIPFVRYSIANTWKI